MALPDPVFPPLLTAHAVKAPRQPFAHACRSAAGGQLGAGDLLWSRSHDEAAMAVVLEPEVGGSQYLQMAPLMLVAAGECLAALMPPQVPITHRWPDQLLVDGATVGRLAIAHAPLAAPEAIPDWLVVGITIRLRFSRRDGEPGDSLGHTALYEEGGGDLDRTRVLEALSAHFLSRLDGWQEGGFRPVHQAFMDRLDGKGAPVEVARRAGPISGVPLGLDEAASLILKAGTAPACAVRLAECLPLVPGAD